MGKFFNKLNEHNTKLLVAQINAKGGKAEASVESIIDNIAYLAEKGESFGEETQFIRLDVRRALASLCDDGRIVFKIEPSTIKWAEGNDAVSLGGYLYLVTPDGNERVISSFACGGCARKDVYRNDDLTNPERQAKMLSMASARAESNAYYNAGIGIEYKGGDIFDLEAMEKEIPAPEPVMPEPKSVEERKATRGKKKAEAAAEPAKTETVEQPKAEESTPAPVEEKASEPAKTEVVEENPLAENATTADAADNGQLTYEDALNVLLDNGQNKGQPISAVIANPRTSRNVVWVYKNEPKEGRSEETKAALEAVIEGFQGGALKRFL